MESTFPILLRSKDDMLKPFNSEDSHVRKMGLQMLKIETVTLLSPGPKQSERYNTAGKIHI